jgi:hypothetical protein
MIRADRETRVSMGMSTPITALIHRFRPVTRTFLMPRNWFREVSAMVMFVAVPP